MVERIPCKDGTKRSVEVRQFDGSRAETCGVMTW